MSYEVFIDDERMPPFHLREAFIVRSYEEAVQFFEDMIPAFDLPDYISFDHDLGTSKSGYDILKWLIDYCLLNDLHLHTHCVVHSMNPVGKENIEKLVLNFQQFQEMQGDGRLADEVATSDSGSA